MAPAVDTAKLMKAARDFEAMAIGQLLQPMFDTVDTSRGRFGGGSGEAAWKPMLVQELAKQVEAHGGLGLTGPIYSAMLLMQEGRTQGGALKQGGSQAAPAEGSTRHE
jgi:Rod binding domain-containing protein